MYEPAQGMLKLVFPKSGVGTESTSHRGGWGPGGDGSVTILNCNGLTSWVRDGKMSQVR